MVHLKIYSFFVLWAEDLWDRHVLALRECGRRACVRVYLLAVRSEVGGIVFDALEELLPALRVTNVLNSDVHSLFDVAIPDHLIHNDTNSMGSDIVDNASSSKHKVYANR